MNVNSQGIPLATIVCITYNHAPYIRQAIDSFLAQQTDFDYKILIHDDASTDGTDSIVRDYVQKYPNKIEAILQTENQYSKNPHMWEHICFSKVKSKYIAICEGDDFWNSPRKLQKQIEKMESDPDISMTCCNSFTITADGEQLRVVNPYQAEGYVSSDDIINSSRSMLSTCTVVFRNDVLNHRTDFYEKTITGDFPLEVLCATNGKVYYFEEPMASYRTMVPGSWSQTMTDNRMNEKKHLLSLTTSRFLLDIRQLTGSRFSTAINGRICKYLYSYISTQGNTAATEYKSILQSLPAKERLMLRMIALFPKTTVKIRSMLQRSR